MAVPRASGRAASRSQALAPGLVRRLAGWLRPEALLPAALTLLFTATSVGATPFRHGPLALLSFTALYGCLALFLHLGARFALRAGRVWGALACLGLALVAAAEQRIDAERLVRGPVFALFTLALGAAYFLALRRLRASAGPGSARAAGVELIGAYAALGVLVWGVGLAAREPELFWHLLKHHRVLGTPLYALGSRPLDAERNNLWARRGRLSEPWEQAESAPPAPVPFVRPPHIVFVLLDTLRADALGALGGRADVMPRTDERVRGATLFSDVRANASWTRASCASIFTGLLPEEHGAARFHEKLSERWHTLPERLQEAGYQTAAFVSNWVQVGRQTGFAQGFDVFRELNDAHAILEQTGEGAGETEVRGAYARAATLKRDVLDWLESPERDPYKPVFLYLHFLDPHSPYLEPPEPETLGDAHERKRGLYRQQLRYLDRELDELLRRLERELGPTVLVLTSDHGEEFWEHDDWGHGHSLYKELVWVPLVVGQPGKGGAVCAAPLENRDLYALVLDLAAQPQLDLARWGAAHARPVRYSSQYLERVDDARDDKKWTGLRRIESGGRALIWSAFGPTCELYRLTEDPGELDNRIAREPEPAAELTRALEHAVRFWTAPERVERSESELSFLRQLGYAGGP